MKLITLGALIDGALEAVNQLENGIHSNKTIQKIEFPNNKTIKFIYKDGTWSQAEMLEVIKLENNISN